MSAAYHGGLPVVRHRYGLGAAQQCLQGHAHSRLMASKNEAFFGLKKESFFRPHSVSATVHVLLGPVIRMAGSIQGSDLMDSLRRSARSLFPTHHQLSPQSRYVSCHRHLLLQARAPTQRSGLECRMRAAHLASKVRRAHMPRQAGSKHAASTTTLSF